jgi:hypothetical protein
VTRVKTVAVSLMSILLQTWHEQRDCEPHRDRSERACNPGVSRVTAESSANRRWGREIGERGGPPLPRAVGPPSTSKGAGAISVVGPPG